MTKILDENDLKEIFGNTSEKTTGPVIEFTPAQAEKIYAPQKFTWQTLVKFLSLFVIIFITSYFIINEPALVKKISYAWDVSFKRENYSKALPTPTANPFNAASEASLVIPKIGIEAPIVWNVEENDLKNRLLEGVVHSKGTALPGQQGNIFITGHSSYYSWVNSSYKDVFALLDKLSAGDKIYIKYSTSIFTYEVSGWRIVAPDDISVIDQGSGQTLTLMTCVPIGTNLNRLIISANQISGSS